MNNREFYTKWGTSSELKNVVNMIVFKGLQMFTGDDTVLNDAFKLTDYIDAAGISYDSLAVIECYNDLRKMNPGFIKNVIKKVL